MEDENLKRKLISSNCFGFEILNTLKTGSDFLSPTTGALTVLISGRKFDHKEKMYNW